METRKRIELKAAEALEERIAPSLGIQLGFQDPNVHGGTITLPNGDKIIGNISGPTNTTLGSIGLGFVHGGTVHGGRIHFLNNGGLIIFK